MYLDEDNEDIDKLLEARKNLLKSVIKDYFGEEMKLYCEKNSFEICGNFLLKYTYTPCEYRVIIEHECKLFHIEIRKEDNAVINLDQIVKYNEKFEVRNVYKAIRLLKKALKKKIYFYKMEAGEIYMEQEDGTYKRIEPF